MNLPSVPTDSLYKFLAIAGLFSLLLFIVAPQYLAHQTRINIITLAVDIEIAELEVGYNTKDIEAVEEAVKEEDEKSQKLDNEILSLHEKAKEKNRQNQRRIVELKSKSKLIDYYKQLILRLIIIGTFGSMISSFAMLYGFYRWYVKVQKPLDSQVSLLNE